MNKKIYLSESQFRDFMRFKLHEGKQNTGKKIRLTEEQVRHILSSSLIKEEIGAIDFDKLIEPENIVPQELAEKYGFKRVNIDDPKTGLQLWGAKLPKDVLYRKNMLKKLGISRFIWFQIKGPVFIVVKPS